MRSTLRERLYAKLPRRPDDGCWPFEGAKNRAGYGNIYVGTVEGRTVTQMVHRASYELHVGPIPEGLQVLHRCDNPSCCNPRHLFTGTQADNMRDKSAKGRARPGPVTDPDWWTEKRREKRRAKTKRENDERRQRKQDLAGAPHDTKFCPTCRRWRPKDEFGRNRARHDGLQPYCKPCRNAAEIVRHRRKTGRVDQPRRATRSDKKHFL